MRRYGNIPLIDVPYKHAWVCECGEVYHSLYTWAYHASHCEQALELEFEGTHDPASECHSFVALASPRSAQRIEALEIAARAFGYDTTPKRCIESMMAIVRRG